MKIVGFAGYSGSGKTTLLEQLIPRFVARGLKVSVIKHAHHQFDIDVPGKDSYRHRQAGAAEVLLSSSQRWVLMSELRGQQEPSLFEQLKHFAPCDWVFVEGFKRSVIPKIEIWRSSVGKPSLYPEDPNIMAIACDGTPPDCTLPILSINDPDEIVNFLINSASIPDYDIPR